jgi:hypothetical protein
MKDFSARDFSLIMESYKKITTVKDVTTKAPNKVSKKAVIATPAKKAVPANYCKQCKDVVIKTKKLNESEDIDQSLAVLDDVDIDSNGVGDNEEVAKSSTYVERPREERKRMFLDRMSQFQDGIDSRAREKLDSDEEYKKFLNYREKVRAEELDRLSREWDAEEDRLERDATAWAKDRFGDDYIEVDDEEDVATDDSSDNSSPEDSEDFWSKTVILNGEEMTREEARKKCRRTILQIDSKSNGDELDADDEARVVALQDAIREIRRGADEVNVDFNEATCESTIKRCSCGKGRSRKCSCGKKGAHKCSCENNINENKNSNPDLEGLVVDFFTNNPEALKKLQSGEVDIGEIMDKVSFANAIDTGKDMVASTNSPSFQVSRNIARKVQSKLQDGGVESALDYWSNGNVRTKDGRRIPVKSVVNQASKNYSKHLDGLEQVNDPNPKAAKDMLNNVSLRVTGNNIDTVTNGMRK